MHIETRGFGKLDFDADRILEFPEGLLGLPSLKRFLHLAPEDTEPLEYLQALDEPRLAFPVLSPYLVAPDYDFELSERERRALGLEARGGDLLVLCVATLGRDARASTLNLLAPVLVNPALRRGRQVILEDSGYSARAPLVASPGPCSSTPGS